MTSNPATAIGRGMLAEDNIVLLTEEMGSNRSTYLVYYAECTVRTY